MLLPLLAAFAYLGLTAYAYHSLTRSSRISRAERLLFGLTLIIHLYTLSTHLWIGTQLKLGFAVILSAAMLVGLVIFWIESLFIQIDGLRLLLLPLGALSVTLPLFFSHGTLLSMSHSVWLAPHLIIAIISYSVLTICTLHALLMGAIDHQLRPSRFQRQSKPQQRFFDQLPPLLVLEKLLFRLIALGFTLLTLTIITGSAFSLELSGKWFLLDHKTVFTLLSWLVFAILLIGHHQRGWRGRKALRWVYSGFICLLLAYVGSRFVLEIIVQR